MSQTNAIWQADGFSASGTVLNHPCGFQVCVPRGQDYLPVLAMLNRSDEIDTLRAHLSKLQDECRAWRAMQDRADDICTNGPHDGMARMAAAHGLGLLVAATKSARAAVDLAGSLLVGKEPAITSQGIDAGKGGKA